MEVSVLPCNEPKSQSLALPIRLDDNNGSHEGSVADSEEDLSDGQTSD